MRECGGGSGCCCAAAAVVMRTIELVERVANVHFERVCKDLQQHLSEEGQGKADVHFLQQLGEVRRHWIALQRHHSRVE